MLIKIIKKESQIKKLNKYLKKFDVCKIDNLFLILNQLKMNSVDYHCKELSMTNCNIDLLYHFDFTKLSKLVKLDLSNNNLKHIPLNLHLCVNLKEIILKNNRIDFIHKDIVKINSLKYLDLSNNDLKSFHIESIPINIQYLDLSNNHFYNINLFIDKNIFKFLEKIILDNCRSINLLMIDRKETNIEISTNKTFVKNYIHI
jgi:Leucine-rich repeat (LRR) protein